MNHGVRNIGRLFFINSFYILKKSPLLYTLTEVRSHVRALTCRERGSERTSENRALPITHFKH